MIVLNSACVSDDHAVAARTSISDAERDEGAAPPATIERDRDEHLDDDDRPVQSLARIVR